MAYKDRAATEMARRALESIGYPFDEESIVALILSLLHLAMQEQIDPRQVVARAALQFHEIQGKRTKGLER